MAILNREPSGPTGTRAVPAGVDWDAVRVPRADGLAALHRLSQEPAAVVVDPRVRALYFFVPPGTTSRWPDFPRVSVLGTGQQVVLPPPGQLSPPGPYWLVEPSEPWALADPEELLAVLQAGEERVTPVRGTYVADTRPERFAPPSAPWIARVQMPLYDGTVRVVAPYGIEWTVHVTDLRPATADECAAYDKLVPRLAGASS